MRGFVWISIAKKKYKHRKYQIPPFASIDIKQNIEILPFGLVWHNIIKNICSRTHVYNGKSILETACVCVRLHRIAITKHRHKHHILQFKQHFVYFNVNILQTWYFCALSPNISGKPVQGKWIQHSFVLKQWMH